MNVKVFGSNLKGNMDKQGIDGESAFFKLSNGSYIPTCSAPPSKSHSIRFLLLASLASGKSTISNVLESADIESCYKCLNSIGVKFAKTISGNGVNVQVFPPQEGVAEYVAKRKKIVFDVGNSGTLLYMLSMFSASLPCVFCFMGDASIKSRPITPICEALEEMNIVYEIPSSDSKIITIHGRIISDNLHINLHGKFSQVVSGLLLSMPFFHKKTHLVLKICGEMPYVKMTVHHLKNRNIKINISNSFTEYLCEGGQSIEGFICSVPSDWSSASFLALASIASSSPIAISHLPLDACQADSALLQYLAILECPYTFKNDTLTIKHSSPCMKAGIFNLANTPDALPALSSIASLANGKTIFEGIDICRYKECNRVKAMTTELAKLGVDSMEKKDSLEIIGTKKLKGNASLHSYKDHRIALSLISLSLALDTNEHSIIDHAECCNISYPNFINMLTSLGARIEMI